ncbi:hypothetical protein Tco_1080892 [Tanacetum coccineum]|uniref:Reverse transcriptase domain-containing protein n=1 Tax=Tanacetum coccineum TaxID=301880 RepID=A0ABQ5HY01_9ASTR
MEGLHVAMDTAMDHGLFRGMSIGLNEYRLSHLLYGDDAIFLGEWDENNIKNLITILNCFYLVSGLRLNLSKSNLHGIGVTSHEVSRLANITGCAAARIPFRYLGLPVGSNMGRIQNWNEMIQRVKHRLSKWKVNLLSIGGRYTLIRSVLSSVSIYYMSLFKVPESVIKELERYRSTFFWGEVLMIRRFRGLNGIPFRKDVMYLSGMTFGLANIGYETNFPGCSIWSRINNVPLLSVGYKISGLGRGIEMINWKMDRLPMRMNLADKDIDISRTTNATNSRQSKRKLHGIFSTTSFTLKLLSNNDLKGTRTECGFKCAFATLFGQDVETFTSTMHLNMDQLEKQLDKEEFQEIGSMAAFKVLETQFQMFIKSRIYLDDEYVVMTRNYFLQYTQLEIPEFRDTLIQHMESVKKSIDERAHHKREYDSRVNERRIQTTEEKVNTSKALDASLVDTKSSGTESGEQDTSSRSGNDAHADDADIRPIYDEEPMAENAEQYHDTCHLPAKLTDNQTTEHSNQSLEYENIWKLVLQPRRNQSVVRQPTAFKSEPPRFSKQRFASQVDVNNNLSKPATTHYLPKERESAVAKPHHKIAPGSSKYSSNDMEFSTNEQAMTSDHNSSELGIHDHNNEPSSSKLVPKVVPPADKTATSSTRELAITNFTIT